MAYASVSRTEQAHADLLRSEPIRFLVGSGVLPPRLDDEFERCLKFVIQAKTLGLSIAEIRQLLTIVRAPAGARDTHQSPAQLRAVP